MALTREQILAQAQTPLRIETVPVPEWSGDVLIREWTGTERDRFENQFVTKEGKRDLDAAENARARMVAASVVDEHGNLEFTVKDIAVLGSLSAAALDRVFKRVRDLNNMSDKDVAELEKN